MCDHVENMTLELRQIIALQFYIFDRVRSVSQVLRMTEIHFIMPSGMHTDCICVMYER